MPPKKYLLFFLYAFAFIPINAQYGAVDSLKNLLAKATDDSIRVSLFGSISDEYYLALPDSAMFYAQQGLALAIQNDYKRGQARSLARIGNVFTFVGDFTNALATHLESLKISEEINDKSGMAASNNNMALVYVAQEEYRPALEYYFKAKESYELMLKDLEKVKPPNEVMIKRCKGWLVTVSLNIGDNYQRMNILDSALQFQNNAYNQAIIIDDKANLGAIQTNLGYIYFEKKMYQEALLSYRLGIPYLLAIDDKRFLAIVYQGIGSVFQKTGPPDSAISYAERSLSAAQEGNFREQIINAANLLADLYDSLKDSKNAFHYLKLAKATSDSIFNLAKVSQLHNLSSQEKFRQQQMAEVKKRAAKERKNNLQKLAIIILMIPLFGAIVKIHRQKHHPKAIRALGLFGLLLLFEFVFIFLNPYMGRITNDNSLYTLLIFIGIAVLMVLIYYSLDKWIRMYLDVRHTNLIAPEDKDTRKNSQENKNYKRDN